MLSAKERALLFRELGDMLRSSLPVERTLSVASKARRGKMAEVLGLMAQRVRKGDSLEDAFMDAERRFPGHFSKWEIRYIGLGEKAGRLPEFLIQIADQAEEAWSLSMELISSCAYPLLLLYISILVGPLAKLILKGPIPYLADVWFPLVVVTAGLAGLGIAFRHTTYRRAILGALRPVPALGRVVNLASQLRLISGLGLAYRSGIPIDEAWQLAADAADDPTLARIAREVRSRIDTTGEVAPLLDRYPSVFAKEVRTAYHTGEETGRLDVELLHVANFMRGELETARKTAAKLVNFVFYLAVMLQMVRNALGIYGPALDMINDATQAF